FRLAGRLDIHTVVARAQELHELELGRGAEELAADPAREAHEVFDLGGDVVELRRAHVGDHELVAGRRHRARDAEDLFGLVGREEDLGCHARLSPYASGTVAVTTGSLPTTRVVCPLPVVSSTRRA